MIDELNRMIRKGEENTVTQETQVPLEKLDLACCCPTGWVHVERDIDFTDPKVSTSCKKFNSYFNQLTATRRRLYLLMHSMT